MRRRGFTLVELLAVLVIMVIIGGIAMGMLAMTSSGRSEAAANVLGSAVHTARAFAQRTDPNLDDGQRGSFGVERRMGTALVVRGREAHVAVHVASSTEGIPYATRRRIHVRTAPDIRAMLPSGSGAFGVQWVDGRIRFVPPPFAVRFDRDGRHVYGDPDWIATADRAENFLVPTQVPVVNSLVTFRTSDDDGETSLLELIEQGRAVHLQIHPTTGGVSVWGK